MSQGRISGKYSRTTRNFPQPETSHEETTNESLGDVDGLAIDVGRTLLVLSPCLALFVSARHAVFPLVFTVSIVRKD